MMFDGFTTEQVDTGSASILVRHGGDGPPVLLLHGHPRTSSTWHRVAPRLTAAGFTVVCPDLTGYGRSRGPRPSPDHAAHSKRAVAADMAAMMTTLGHDQFFLRLTLDDPDRVLRLAALDFIPISEHLHRANARFATAYWHWFFFAQPDIPERVINADPDRCYRGDPAAMGQENYDEFRAATRDPNVVTAMLEDYRAGLAIDGAAEEADFAAGRRVTCPLLVLWSLRDDLEDLHGDPRTIWRRWAHTVTGAGIDSGHHMAEQAPDQLSRADRLLPIVTMTVPI